VHIASSSNAGETWTFASKVNTPTPVSVPSGGTINCGEPTCQGMLTHETSSLIVDPFDPDPSRRFKVASQAFIHGTGFLYIHGYMAFQTSADGVTWSADEALVEWPTTPTNANPPLPKPIVDASKIPELADCFILLEPALALRPPSASVEPGAIDLAATCLTGNPKEAQGRIVLFRSTDHAKSFQYKGVLLSSADGSCLGSSTPFITAADLFFVGGQEYLSASLPDPTNGYGGYLNCLMCGVLGAGAAPRDAEGHPKMLRQIAADTGHLGGACTFAEGASKAGYMGNWGTALPAHIFASGFAEP
jgi:hypothetical protein